MARRLVVIGGDAAGMGAASQARRLDPGLEIIALERGHRTSYSACGIPYLVSGDVEEVDDLVVRTPDEFRLEHRIDVRTRHEATAVDLDRQTVEVRDLERGRTIQIGYDELLFGTGAHPVRPDLPGIDQPWVHGVQTLDDGVALLEAARASGCRDVVVVGAGYIGLEMAEAFHRWGARVALVEGNGSVLSRTVDPDMGALVVGAVEGLGIDVHLHERVQAFEPGRVVTDRGALPADLAILALGVAPNSGLAGAAGVALGARGAIAVDRRQRAGAGGVWAAGDCADTLDLVSGRRVHIALGTVANRTARVAGINLGGGYATFPGVVGTAVTRVCSTEIGRSGLTEAQATRAGFEHVVARIGSTGRAGYFPGAEPLTVKVLAERTSRRLLGVQIVGGAGAAKRIDVAATALQHGLTVDDVIDLDLSYAPPFSPVWEPLQVAARQAATLLGRR